MPRRSQKPPSGHTILVVDDQQETLASVRLLLERDGHRVLTSDCGERALELFKQNDVHLVLLDYFMPRMTGEDVVREIRTFDPFVQIILQTGYAQKPPRQMLADLDIQGYHDKSEGPEALLRWVNVGLKAHRRLSDMRQRQRMQAELVANVSHEIRTPLCVIGGYCEMLSDGTFGALPPDMPGPLTAVSAATSRMTELVSDFLNYAKLEARVMEVNREWIGVADLMRDLRDMGARLLDSRPEANVRFCVEAPGVDGSIFTDDLKVKTIVRNLLTNAVKFTVSGSILLRLERHEGAVCFLVRDTGPGIHAEDLALIFEPFRQLDGSTTRDHGGIGLGLALSRDMARLLGGDLRVESEPGVGSTFTFVLPTPAPTADTATTTGSERPAPSPPSVSTAA